MLSIEQAYSSGLSTTPIIMSRETSSTVLSPHSLNGSPHWDVQAFNVNPWCRLSGSPFSQGLALVPNHPDVKSVSVIFRSIRSLKDIDTLSFFFVGDGGKNHNSINVNVSTLSDSWESLNHSQVSLSYAEEKLLTLKLEAGEDHQVFIRFDVSFRDFIDPVAYGRVNLRYALGFKTNPLVDLFNNVGSDKGTESCAEKGVPHCYALDYYHLLRDFQEEFNFLEIGLDNASKDNHSPQDAPSLRVWREFFPQAKLFGFDINDFSFFKQERTSTFQGDQSSRQDLQKFIETFQGPQFRVVVDDGSHASSHQQISLAALFPHVEPLGLYIIEDLSWQPFEESPKTLDLLRKFNETGKFESPFITEEEAGYLQEAVEKVEIYKPNDSAFAVIYKKLMV